VTQVVTTDGSRGSETRLSVVPLEDPAPASIDSVVAVRLVAVQPDHEIVARVIPSLASEGISAGMVSGAPGDVQPLIAALRGAEGPTVFVMCTSDNLGPEHLRRLVETFARLRSRTHRLLVLELDRTKPYALLAGIRRAVGALVCQLEMVFITSDEREGSRTTVHGSAVVRDVTTAVALPPPGQVIVSHPLRDEVGPIPPHIRLPRGASTRPHLRVVRDTGEMTEEPPTLRTTVPPVELPAPTSTTRYAISGWRIGMGLVTLTLLAALASSASRAEGPEAPTNFAWRPELHHVPEKILESSVTSVVNVQNSTPPAPNFPLVAAPSAIIAFRGSFYSEPMAGEGDWWKAANYCRSNSSAGLQGWRLPRSGELDDLRRAQLLPPGRYWSMSLVSHAEVPSNWVVDQGSGRISSVAKTRTAGAVCVHRGEDGR